MEKILLVILTISMVFWIICAIKNYSVKKNQFWFFWGIITITIFFLALNFKPKTFIDWDLIRLFKHIENVRTMGLDKALRYTEYRSLYIIKMWMYLVSLTKINGLFQAFPILIDFLIFGYLMKDTIIKNKEPLKMRKMLMVSILWICLMGIKLSISDVRCTWAMGICCLAFYWEYICNRKKIFSIILYLVAMSIHHFTILFFIFRVLLNLQEKIKRMWILLFASLLSQFVIYEVAIIIFENVNNDYLKTMARKLLADWQLYGFTNYFFSRESSMKLLYLCFVFVFIYGYWVARKLNINFLNYDCEVDKKVKKINNSLYVLCCLGIGFSFNYLLLERLIYVAAYIFSLHYSILSNRKEYSVNIKFLIPVLIYIVYFNDINIFIVNAMGHYYL